MDETESNPIIMVVAAEAEDTEVLRHILDPEYSGVIFETEPDSASAAFVQRRPAVLVMAFGEISAAEHFYLGLFRSQDNAAAKIPHQAIVLCSNKEADKAYKLCRTRVFDDYLAFRPLHDPNQIKLSIYQALERFRLHSVAIDTAPVLRSAPSEFNKMGSLVSNSVDAARDLDREISQSTSHLSQQMGSELEVLHQLIVQREFDSAIKLVDRYQGDRHINALKGRLHELKRHPPPEGILKAWLDRFERETRKQIDKINHQVQSQLPRAILVVEDDGFIQRVYQHILGKAGLSVFIAEDGYTALRHLSQQLPDLILMDIMLPDINGIEITRRVKADTRFRDTPIIIASGRAEHEMVHEGIAAGACDFIVKPVDEKVLLEKLKKYLVP